MTIYKVKKSNIDNKGLYAAKNIKAGTKIIYYKGKLITKKETERNPKYDNDKAIYLFNLNNRYDLDGDFTYNTARLINHSCNPNCEVAGKGLKLWIFSLRNIKKGEELSYDYGFGFDEDYKQFPCKCGSKNCCGYIVREGSRWRIKKIKKMVQKEFKDKVSIILPNFNSAKYISSTINSIKKQSYKYWNLIIVDDCSNVETKKILNKFNNKKKIKIFWLKKNKGAAYCRNLAIKKSKSKYLAFIDSDDIWEKNKLKLQIDYMRKNNFDFTYTYYKTFGLKLKKIKPPPRLNFEDFTKNTSIATSTMILNRKMAEGIKFTETAICEDYFFKCKILKKIKHAYCLKNYLTKYRVRQGSLQSSKIKNFFWIWKINYKYNKFNFFENLKSLLFISFNSIKKYGLK